MWRSTRRWIVCTIHPAAVAQYPWGNMSTV
jgi:hypothetical protein